MEPLVVLLPLFGALLAMPIGRLAGPRAAVAIKKLIPEIASAAIDAETSEKTAQRIAELRTTAEAQEGLTAFLEKRKPSWVNTASSKPKDEK